MQARTALREYVELQERLLTEYRRTRPVNERAPATGEVSCPEVWRFTRHGAGVRFESSDGCVVDAHVGEECPRALDAWRLFQYFTSRGVRGVSYAGDQVRTDDEMAIKRFLDRCHTDGALQRQFVHPFGIAKAVYVLA